MSILCLNCRGLGDPEAVGKLRRLIRKLSPKIIFLSETKRSTDEMVTVLALLQDLQGFFVGSIGRAGGLALLWGKDIPVQILSHSLHHIDCSIDGWGSMGKWRFTGIYGWYEKEEKWRHGGLVK